MVEQSVFIPQGMWIKIIAVQMVLAELSMNENFENNLRIHEDWALSY